MKTLGQLLICCSLFVLAACETPVTVPHYANITFSHRPTIALDVAEIRIVEAYEESVALPHVETEFPVRPMEMAAQWARDRLQAVGTSGELVFTIRDARVIEVPLETSGGVSGLVTVDQAERYEARLIVELSATNPSRGINASANTRVERQRTVAEDVTLNEREGIWYNMVENMAADLDPQLEGAIEQYFASFRR